MPAFFNLVCGLVFGFFLSAGPLVDRQARADETTLNLEIEQRALTASTNTFRLSQGDQVTLHWTADETVDLHLHGYDLKAQVTPGQPATLSFTAHTAGRFPLSAHNFDHATLLYLEIYPK